MYFYLKNGSRCFCASSFGAHGSPTSGCDVTCYGSTSDDVTCGGPNKNDVYRIQGAFSDWATGQPDNFGNTQACGAMDYVRDFKLTDRNCQEHNQYVCDIGKLSETFHIMQ